VVSGAAAVVAGGSAPAPVVVVVSSVAWPHAAAMRARTRSNGTMLRSSRCRRRRPLVVPMSLVLTMPPPVAGQDRQIDQPGEPHLNQRGSCHVGRTPDVA